ncbi:MAG TPA: BrnA antitoxin family protein [Rectinemataceae bacterium]|nr:BrnA antitoxin family protein [Rectinemataceae bacterium]
MKRVEGIGERSLAEREELARLAERPETAIDTSDIAEWTADESADAVRLGGHSLAEAMDLYRARKTAITARIDRDVLAWLKSQGRGYQTRINAILRDAMLRDTNRRAG